MRVYFWATDRKNINNIVVTYKNERFQIMKGFLIVFAEIFKEDMTSDFLMECAVRQARPYRTYLNCGLSH